MHTVSLFVLFGNFAAMASRSRRNQPGQRNDFLWYTFPRVVGPEVLAQWNAKLGWMKHRKGHVPAVVDWQWIDQTGLLEGISCIWLKTLLGYMANLCAWGGD